MKTLPYKNTALLFRRCCAEGWGFHILSPLCVSVSLTLSSIPSLLAAVVGKQPLAYVIETDTRIEINLPFDQSVNISNILMTGHIISQWQSEVIEKIFVMFWSYIAKMLTVFNLPG